MTQDCFEGEAEVVQASQKDSSLHFEEEDTCVHPSKPNFDAEAAMDFDSTSEGDLEASSLAGSVRHSCRVLTSYNQDVPAEGIERCDACQHRKAHSGW